MVHYFVNSLPPGYWMVQLWQENVRSFKTLQGQLYTDYLFRFPIILLVLRENWTSVDLPRPLLCEVQIYPLGAWGLGILLGPFCGLLVVFDNPPLGLEVDEGIVESLPKLLLALMLDWLLLTTRVLPL